MSNDKKILPGSASRTGCGECDAKGLSYCKHKKQAGGRGGGSGGSGGGSGSGSGEGEAKGKEATNTSSKIQGTLEQAGDHSKTVESKLTPDESISIEKIFASLSVEKKLDKDGEGLVIRSKTVLSKEQEQKIFKAICLEFEAFKKELKEKGISVKGYDTSIKDNKLTLNMPGPGRYQDAFIQRLIDKKLLPGLPQQEKTETSRKTPTPLPTKLKRGE